MKISLKLKPSEIAFIRDRLNDAIREIKETDEHLIRITDNAVNVEIRLFVDKLNKRLEKVTSLTVVTLLIGLNIGAGVVCVQIQRHGVLAKIYL